MRKRVLLKALVIIAFLAFVIQEPIPSSHAANAGIVGSLTHNVSIDKYGIYIVTDTLLLTNNGSLATTVGGVTIGYPSAFSGHVFSPVSRIIKSPSLCPSTVPLSGPTLSSNVTTLSIDLSCVQLTPKANATVQLVFYSQKLLSPQSASNFTAPIPLLPSANIPLSAATSKIVFAHDLSLPGGGVAFTSKSGFTFSSPNSTNDQVARTFPAGTYSTPLVNVTALQVSGTDAGAVDFTNVRRVLTVASDGSMSLVDFVTLHNYGLSEIDSLTLNLPGNPSSVTLLPVGIPPLSNPQAVSVSGGSIDLKPGTSQVAGGSNVTIAIQYPVPKSLYTTFGTSFVVNIPQTPPVNLADSFVIQLSAPNGYVVFTPNSHVYAYAGSDMSGHYSMAYRPGLAWATYLAIPVASGFALFVFLAALILRPSKAAEEAAEIPKKLGGLIRVYEDKISGNLEILNEFKGSKVGEVSRASLDDARRRIDEIRSRTGSRVNELRPSIAARPDLANLFNNLTNTDREYDRAVKDVLNIYDQYFTRKIREETYARMLPDRQRRLERLTASLTDAVTAFQREYEK